MEVEKMDCIFCKINNGDIPYYTIYEDDFIRVFLDINPQSVGHCLIVPKMHFVDLFDIDREYMNHILEKAKMIGKGLMRNFNADGIMLVQNNGICQDVKHFHLHIIPKYSKPKKMDIENVYDILKKDTFND